MTKQRKPKGFWNQTAEQLAIAHPPSDANSNDDYIRVMRDGELVYLHRWLWEQLVGPIPEGYQIDHRNGIRTDCRLENLRCSEQVVNLRNSSQRSDNTSGIRGVDRWRQLYWRASCHDPITKKHRCKVFSIAKYGDETAFEMARSARQAMIQELNAQGAGYTERHGS